MTKVEICKQCKEDQNIFYPRNTDGKCLECGVELCAGHLMIHFKKVHCMALGFEHCSMEKAEVNDGKDVMADIHG